MSFSGEILSCALQYDTIATLDYDVTISQNLGGYETRNLNREQAVRVWELGERNMNKTDMLTLRSFYQRQNGPEKTWLLDDVEENGETGESLTITNGQAFLGRQHIKAGTVTIYENGSPFTDYTLNTTTGVATFGSPTPTGTMTWDGEFYKHVRFDGPFRTSLISKDGSGDPIFRVLSLPVVEVPEVDPI